MYRTVLLVLAPLLAAGCQAPAEDSTQSSLNARAEAPITWHPQNLSGYSKDLFHPTYVDGSSLLYQRKENAEDNESIKIQWATNYLPNPDSATAVSLVGHVVSMHVYVFNHPENCVKPIPALGVKCSVADVTTPGVEGSLVRVSSEVVADNGMSEGAVRINIGDESVCYTDHDAPPCHGGIQSADAGMIFCARDHGPASADPDILAAQLNDWSAKSLTGFAEHFEQLNLALAPRL